MKLLNLFLLLCIAITATAGNYDLSEPFELSRNGWSKVIQASNGNTILIHFDLRKPIITKVFDASRKEVASNKFVGKLLDVNVLDRTELHGIYEIGNEVVVFLSQPVNNHETLIRLHISEADGKIVKEDKVLESVSFKNSIEFHVVRKATGGYAVFAMKDLLANFQEKLTLLVYDEQHNKKKEIDVKIDSKEYDFINHISTVSEADGSIVVGLFAQKIIHYPSEMDNYLFVNYLSDTASAFATTITRLPSDKDAPTPYYLNYSYDGYNKRINLFLVNAVKGYINNGLQKVPTIIYTPMMIRYPSENFGGMNYNFLTYPRTNKYLMEQTDSLHHINPLPMWVNTNKFGLTTLISEVNEQEILDKNKITDYAHIGDISISQVNEEGEEIWATILPKKQFVQDLITPNALTKRVVNKRLFRMERWVEEWNTQMVSFKSFVTPKGNCYVLYNDMPANFEKKLNDNIDSLYFYNRSNAVCYKVSKKRETSKEHLFGPADSTQNYPVLLEGGDYNEKSLTYAALVLNKLDEGDKVLYRLGWRKFEE